MELRNKTIIKDRNISAKEAFGAVRAYLKEDLGFLNGYIYINCPSISDLFIINRRTIRKCYDKEWNKYYKEYLSCV